MLITVLQPQLLFLRSHIFVLYSLKPQALLVGTSLAVMLTLLSSMTASSTPTGSVTEQPRTLHSRTGIAKKVSSERQVSGSRISCMMA